MKINLLSICMILLISGSRLNAQIVTTISRSNPTSSTSLIDAGSSVTFKVNATASYGLKNIDWYVDGSLKKTTSYSSSNLIYYNEPTWSYTFPAGKTYQVDVYMYDQRGESDHTYWSITAIAPDPANLTLSPTSKNFGSVTIGSSSSIQTFTLTNTGDLSTSGIISVNTSNFKITSGGGNYSLNGGSSRSILIRAEPNSLGNIRRWR